MQRTPTSRGFGRKTDPAAEEMQRKREAFLAAERARRTEQPATPSPHAPTARAASSAPKSLAMAYLLWFLCGAISAHRFYLGFTSSGLIQASLWLVGWMMILGGFYIAILAVAAAAIWMLADAFLIPGLHRRAVERQQGFRTAGAFA